jgi:DNA (cytosine-5)-methyltransferase 1
MAAYYNEIDPYAAQWLRNLIKAGLIADGEVDERSIEEVQADELKGFTQCHFFAGIGGWSYAARLAGWDDDRPLWTGSCPCQPFSAAGKQRGTSDERHLWPVFYELIRQSNPPVVFGEQVASRLGRDWLAGVRADLETVGYAVGAADLCAASVGAPHIRQRLWWVADSTTDRREQKRSDGSRSDERIEAQGWPTGSGLRSTSDWVADAGCGSVRDCGLKLAGAQGKAKEKARQQRFRADTGNGSPGSGLADPNEFRPEGEPGKRREKGHQPSRSNGGLGDTTSVGLEGSKQAGTAPWTTPGGFVYIPCADGKARRLEPSIEPLAHGVSNRVGRLRAYGNAIVPQVAAEFIKAVM